MGKARNACQARQPGTWSTGRDMNRVSGWIEDLQAAEKTGVLPRFMISISLYGEDIPAAPNRAVLSHPIICVAIGQATA